MQAILGPELLLCQAPLYWSKQNVYPKLGDTEADLTDTQQPQNDLGHLGSLQDPLRGKLRPTKADSLPFQGTWLMEVKYWGNLTLRASKRLFYITQTPTY